ncbi:hypothetical protein [Acidaminococcus sp. HCP3S3_G9_1]|uniref:hypothetical protein n=1 Tax=Acidaminococcus sp. HCP3S3_G9_1 TaxID=3438732 RepID=UPI003F9196C1
MSKWTDFRDSMVDAMNLDSVVNDLKDQLVSSLTSDGFPVIEELASTFISKIQEQAAAESGWNKIRDSVVLPLVIRLGLYMMKAVLAGSAKETAEPTKAE